MEALRKEARAVSEVARSGRGARLVGPGLQQQRDDLNAVAGGCKVQRGGASETGWRRRVGAGGLEGHAERGGRREEEERGAGVRKLQERIWGEWTKTMEEGGEERQNGQNSIT